MQKIRIANRKHSFSVLLCFYFTSNINGCVDVHASVFSSTSRVFKANIKVVLWGCIISQTRNEVGVSFFGVPNDFLFTSCLAMKEFVLKLTKNTASVHFLKQKFCKNNFSIVFSWRSSETWNRNYVTCISNQIGEVSEWTRNTRVATSIFYS